MCAWELNHESDRDVQRNIPNAPQTASKKPRMRQGMSGLASLAAVLDLANYVSCVLVYFIMCCKRVGKVLHVHVFLYIWQLHISIGVFLLIVIQLNSKCHFSDNLSQMAPSIFYARLCQWRIQNFPEANVLYYSCRVYIYVHNFYHFHGLCASYVSQPTFI